MTMQTELPLTRTAPGPDSAHAESATFLRGFLGSVVLLLLIGATEPLFFGEGHYSTLTFHPYWIVVLLAAVQHGLFVGVSTVGLATLLMDWPPRPVGMDITAYYADMAATPTQWLIVAALIGLYRQGEMRRDQRLRRDNARLIEMNDALATEVYRVDAALARAELAAATRPETADVAGSVALRPAQDAPVYLSEPAARRADAFLGAARACSNAEIALLNLSATGELVSERSAPDASAHLPDPAKGRTDALSAAARACGDAEIALLELFAAGELVSPQAALDALAHLSDPAANRTEAFIAAARACSEAEIGLLEPSATGELVLTAGTYLGMEVLDSVSIHELGNTNARPNAFVLGRAIAPVGRHALALPVIPAGAAEPIGAVFAFADSQDELSGLTSILWLLALALGVAMDPNASDSAHSPGRNAVAITADQIRV